MGRGVIPSPEESKIMFTKKNYITKVLTNFKKKIEESKKRKRSIKLTKIN